jgi:putative transposase
LFGLSQLAVWWLRLGIRIERIKPGHPEQNGRHERLHLTLKTATVVPAANNLLQQQERFNAFQTEYNTERPHKALSMKYPAEVYTPAPRLYRGVGRVEYPMHDRTVTVTSCGRICMKGKKINLSTVFAGQNVGIKEVKEKIWLVSFMEYDLGYFDEDSRRFEPLQNPFGAKVLPISSE